MLEDRKNNKKRGDQTALEKPQINFFVHKSYRLPLKNSNNIKRYFLSL